MPSCKFIQRANEGASARFNAAVKEIDWIRIGNAAIPSASRVVRVAEQEAAAAGPQMMGGEMPMGGEMMGGDYRGGEMPMGGEMMMGGEFGGVPQVDPDPGEGRYINKDYTMLEEGKLRSVMQDTASVSPEDAYLVVAKRIPVRMRLKVDQRKLVKLLLECANSELTLEVRQVRVNPEDDGSRRGGMFPGMGPMMGGGPEAGMLNRRQRGSAEEDKTFSL